MRVEDVEAAPVKASWRDRAIPADGVDPEDANSDGDNLKRAANWLARGAMAPTGPLATVMPDVFEVEPLKGGTELESAAKGVEQGSSLMFEDENAGVRAGAKALVTGGDPLDAYRKARDADRASVKASREANPKSFIAGELVGSAAVPTPAGKGSVLKSALSGARTGAAMGAGGGEADLTKGEVAQLAAEMGLGAVGGGLGGTLGELGGRAIGKARNAYKGSSLEKFLEDQVKAPVVDALRDTAAIRALKASGYVAKDVKPKVRRDLDEVRDAGQAILDEPGVITPFAKTQDIAQRAKDASQKYGAGIGKLLEEVDSTGATFDTKKFAARARQEIFAEHRNDPIMQAEMGALDKLLKAYEDLGPIKFSEANVFKGGVQKKTNFGNTFNDQITSMPNEFRKGLQRVFHQEIDDQLGPALAPHLGGKAARVVDVFKNLRAKYGPLSEAGDKASQGYGREVGNQFFSQKDSMAGGLGAVGSMLVGGGQVTPGSLATGAALAIAHKLARERGSSVVAKSAEGLANLLEKRWATSLPQILQQSPQILGRYGPVLARELEARGLTGVLAVDRALEQEDPEYRKTKERELAARASDL